jgi:hypothetical protein
MKITKKIKIIGFILISVLIYIGFSYYEYKKITNKLSYIYHELPFKYNIIKYPLWKLRNSKDFPTEKEMNKYLQNLDSVLFAKGNYHLKIDKDKKHILLYSFYPSGKDVKMKNYINLMNYTGNENFLKKISFLDYLLHDYNTLFIDNSYKYKKVDYDDVDAYIWTITR